MSTVLICFLAILAFGLIVFLGPDSTYMEKSTGAIYRLKNITFISPNIIYELQNVHTGEIKCVTKEYLSLHFSKQR